jgi:hypothetical protein
LQKLGVGEKQGTDPGFTGLYALGNIVLTTFGTAIVLPTS